MKRSIKLLISLVVYIWDVFSRWLLRFIGRTPPATCVVLYYHSVPAAQRHLFARQMDALLRLARPLPIASAASLEPGYHYVVVTFDDGFVSVKDNAAPELHMRRIPWALFVPSGCLGQSPGWLRHAHPAARQDRVMTAEELRVLAEEPLLTVGSHTINHAHLKEIGSQQAATELAVSKGDLERILQRPVDQFSYPFGARTPDLDQQARAAGYRRVFTTDPSLAFRASDEFVTGRVGVDPDTPFLEFKLKVLGAYRWMAFKG